MSYAISARNLTDDGDTVVNATGLTIEGFTWPTLTDSFFNAVRTAISNMLIISITLIISQKCLQLKLARTAEHTFYSSLAIVFCMSESMLLSYSIMHMALGLMSFGLGTMGVGIQISHKQILGLKHFRSKHSIFALIGYLLIVGTVGTGFWMLLHNLSKKNAILLQLGHRVCGITSYVTLMTSQLFSYNKGFVRRNWSEYYIRILTYFTFFATITVCVLQFKQFALDVLTTISEEMQTMIPKELEVY